MEFKGISAIVTGGASGLGEATARALAGAGAKVIVADLQEKKGEAVATDIDGRFARTDVTSEEDVLAALAVAAEAGPLRVVVNCAGIGWAQRTVARDGTPHPLDLFQRVVTVNLIGTFNVIRLAASAMSKLDPLEHGERGAIVNTASVAALEGQIGQVAYSASKGGIVGMTLPIARDLSSVGIRVNTICPGIIDTPLLGMLSEEIRQSLAKGVLFPKRLGRPADFASLALELLGNGYLNGEIIRIDGGLRMPPK